MKKVLILLLFVFLVFSCNNDLSDNIDQNDGNENNDPEGPLSAPVISPETGEVRALTQITMSCDIAGALIYYTTDGSEPDTDSILYDDENKPRLLEDTIFKAAAYLDGNFSATVTEAMTMTPYYEDFSLDLTPGTKWNFHSYYHRSEYWGADTYTNEYDFSILIGNPVSLDIGTAYQLICPGTYTSRWH